MASHLEGFHHSPEASPLASLEPLRPERPQTRPAEATLYGRSHLQRAVSTLREDCAIQQKRALKRYQDREVGPEAVQMATDQRIRAWLQTQLRSGRYAQAYMEASRTPERHPCGDVTLVTHDGAAMMFVHPTSVVGFHYLPSDIQRVLPMRFFCTPDVAERMQRATSQLSDLHGLMQEDWEITAKPAVGLVPVELDPRVFTEYNVQRASTSFSIIQKSLNTPKHGRRDPSLETSHGLESVRIGHPIVSVDPQVIAIAVGTRPELRSNNPPFQAPSISPRT